MASERSTAEDVQPRNGLKGRERVDAADAPLTKKVELASLEIEEDECGGDPYNRTGQFCRADLKDRE